jgi:hypothetical protein
MREEKGGERRERVRYLPFFYSLFSFSFQQSFSKYSKKIVENKRKGEMRRKCNTHNISLDQLIVVALTTTITKTLLTKGAMMIDVDDKRYPDLVHKY